MKLVLSIIVFSIFYSSCKTKKYVYLEFKPNKKGSCYSSVYRDRRNKKKGVFDYKKELNKDSLIEFNMCSTYFKQTQEKSIVNQKKYDRLNILSIDSILELESVRFLNKEPFNIKIIEKQNDSTYFIYKTIIIDKSYKNHDPIELYDFKNLKKSE
jgi:hypothetical protein